MPSYCSRRRILHFFLKQNQKISCVIVLWCFRWGTCISCNLSCKKDHANWCPCSRSRHVRVSETTSLHLDNYVGPEVENGVSVCFVCVEGLHRLLYVELTNFLCLWQWYYLTRKERTHRAILLTLFGPTHKSRPVWYAESVCWTAACEAQVRWT